LLQSMHGNRTTVAMMSFIFWNITLCRLLKVNRHLGGTCHIHLQGRKISQVRNQYKSFTATCFHAMPILQPSRWKQYVPLKCWLTFNRLHRSYVTEDRAFTNFSSS
jgi:hypothetical protein